MSKDDYHMHVDVMTCHLDQVIFSHAHNFRSIFRQNDDDDYNDIIICLLLIMMIISFPSQFIPCHDTSW